MSRGFEYEFSECLLRRNPFDIETNYQQNFLQYIFFYEILTLVDFFREGHNIP